jgi:AcrR family transcriptional regulator
MIDAVGSKGYRAVSVADVLGEASVSRTTFYKHFDDKLDCFLAAYDVAVDELVDSVQIGCDPRLVWSERVRAGLTRALELLAADPPLTRAVVVEIAAAGPAGQSRRAAMLDRLAALLDRDDAPAAAGLPANTAAMAAGAALGLLFEEVEAGRTASLPDRLDDLLFAVLVPYMGPNAAGAETRPPLAPSPG